MNTLYPITEMEYILTAFTRQFNHVLQILTRDSFTCLNIHMNVLIGIQLWISTVVFVNLTVRLGEKIANSLQIVQNSF